MVARRRQGWGRLTILLLLASVPVMAGPRTNYTIRPESRLWIEGGSNVHAWRSDATEIQGFINTGALFASYQGTSLGGGSFAVNDSPKVEVFIPISGIRSGNRIMDKITQGALKANLQPRIHYQLLSAELVGRADGIDGQFKFRTIGALTVAGETITVEMTVAVSLEADGLLLAEGQLPMRMSAVGVSPPVALLGMLKTHDEVTIHFSLVTVIDPDIVIVVTSPRQNRRKDRTTLEHMK